MPLDLAPAKNGLPVPVHVTYGGRSVGAAGMGWDVPISYILRDATYAHRLPGYDASGTGGSPPLGTERLTLVLDGQPMLLMRKGNQQSSTTWIPVYDGPQIEVHEVAQSGAMLLYDGAGRTYAFANTGPVGPRGQPPAGNVPLLNGNLYLLTNITTPGNKVLLEYANILFALHGAGLELGTGLEISLRSVSYNSPTSTSGCFKNRIVLTYDEPASAPLSMSMIGNGVLVRMSKLKWIDLHAFDDCSSSAIDMILRRHLFSYDSDPDTAAPRLVSVDLFGRNGTPEAVKPISLGSFTYGTATTPPGIGGGVPTLVYGLRQTVSMPTANDIVPQASLGVSQQASDGSVSTWHELVDFTGDGRPDLVFRSGSDMMLAENHPTASGTAFLTPAPIPPRGTVPVLASPDKPLEHETVIGDALALDPSNSDRHGRTQFVYRQAIDANGDGRIDIVDAHEVPGQWIFYFNTPGSDTSQIAWIRRPVNMAPLITQLANRGFGFEDGYLPLQRRHTGMESAMAVCFKWSHAEFRWIELSANDNDRKCAAEYVNGTFVETTYVEWEVRDFNGDGYVDVVFNHAPVLDVPNIQTPPKPDDHHPEPADGQQQIGQHNHVVILDSTSTIEAVVNVVGPLLSGDEITVSSYPFSAPVQVWGPSDVVLSRPLAPSDPASPRPPPVPNVSSTPIRSCGVALWVEPRPDGPIFSLDFTDVVTEYCSFADVNGDGLPDRVEGLTAFLQGGDGSLGATSIQLPSYAQGHTDRNRTACCDDPDAPCQIRVPCDDAHPCLNEPHNCVCERVNGHCTDLRGTCVGTESPGPTAIDFNIDQTFGLKDVNGDGIPDYLNHFYDSFTRRYLSEVWLGTGSGFAPALPVSISSPGFDVSQENVECPNLLNLGLTQMVGGLYDIDGDGKAEMVFVNGDVYQLTNLQGTIFGSDPDWGRPDAGRLVAIDNGQGARTKITYRSAKEDTITRHGVPFPEIVVTKVETVTANVAEVPLVAAMHHAFGTPQLVLDAITRSWRFSGYRRSVEMRVPVQGHGTMTIVDTGGLDTATASQSATDRFLANGRVGRPSSVTVLSGSIGGFNGNDPWAELGVTIGTDSRVIGATQYDYAARMFQEPGTAGSFCGELAHPYGPLSAVTALQACVSHGFIFAKTQTSWRGTAAPPGSVANVTSQVQITSVDDLGNVLEASTNGDGDPSLTVRMSYASSSHALGSGAPHVLGAIKRRDVFAPGITSALATEIWLYDNDHLDNPAGTVSNGFLTAHSRRRIKDDGSGSLGEDVTELAWDASNGVPTSVTSTREGDDGHITGIRKVLLPLADYDAFKLAPKTVQVVTVGLPGTPPIPTMTTHFDLEPFTLATRGVTDPNGTITGRRFDGLDRVTMTTVTPPLGAGGALTRTSYLGFARGDTDPRSIVRTVFTDVVDPNHVDTAVGRISKVFVDELGRASRTEIQLGADYQNQSVITGLRQYDGLGRVVYEADPYLSTQAPSYGTLRYFKDDGMPDCFVRGPLANFGAPPQRATIEQDEVYPTCFERRFENHRELLTTRGPDSLLTDSPQDGVKDVVALSASGRRLSHTTLQDDVALEYADYGFNALGQLNEMKRYRDPGHRTGAVTTSWKLDSFGLVLELDEVEAAPRIRSYDSWGELVDEQWADETRVHHISSRYDPLGRVVHSDESTQVGAAQPNVDPDTVHDYFYDTAVSVTGTITLSPTNVLGRLARAVSPTQSVVFSYDGFGNVAAKAFSDSQLYVEQQHYHGDGSLASLHLFLPDHTVDDPGSDEGMTSVDEQTTYIYDTAGRVKLVSYTDCTGGSDLASGCTNSIDLFKTATFDILGRVRQAQYGNTSYSATYADGGRRLLSSWSVSATGDGTHSREISFPTNPGRTYDPVGRERERTEVRDGDAAHAVTFTNMYDALGRLQAHKRHPANLNDPEIDYDFAYDPLGNVAELFNSSENVSQNAVLTYPDSGDLDRICRIRYAFDHGTACNVVHDLLGNITQMPLGNGATRTIEYFGGGAVRSISDDAGNRADYKYDALGEVSQLEIDSTQTGATRSDRHYGSTMAARDEMVNGIPQSVKTRTIVLPGGFTATRHGVTSTWIFGFAEERGGRFFTDQEGNFVQDVGYQPYGALLPSIQTPDEQRVATYSSMQWNGEDTLQKLGVTQLGARLYDPIIGRFLSRDPLLTARTAATSNPYAFAVNDPMNFSDPSGLDWQANAQNAFGLCSGPEMCGPRGWGGDPLNPGGFMAIELEGRLNGAQAANLGIEISVPYLPFSDQLDTYARAYAKAFVRVGERIEREQDAALARQHLNLWRADSKRTGTQVLAAGVFIGSLVALAACPICRLALLTYGVLTAKNEGEALFAASGFVGEINALGSAAGAGEGAARIGAGTGDATDALGPSASNAARGAARNALGSTREARAASLTGGQVVNETIVGPFGKTDIDVLARNGSLVMVGGPGKVNDLGNLGRVIKAYQYEAAQRGVGVQAYFDAGTPQSVIDFTGKRIGFGNVFTFSSE